MCTCTVTHVHVHVHCVTDLLFLQFDYCQLEFSPSKGAIGPKETISIDLTSTWNTEVHIPFEIITTPVSCVLCIHTCVFIVVNFIVFHYYV